MYRHDRCSVIFPVVWYVQDKSGKGISAVLARHNVMKFGKLMSVVVVNSWPTEASGHYIEGEDLIFEHLMNWPMAKTVFQMAGKCNDLSKY